MSSLSSLCSGLSLALLATLTLSACQSQVLPVAAMGQNVTQQAILPPDAYQPKPCSRGLSSQAYLPPQDGYKPPTQSPCPCSGSNVRAQAYLPPQDGYKPPHHPTQPGCKR